MLRLISLFILLFFFVIPVIHADESAAHLLDFVSKPGINQCGGYYIEPNLNPQQQSVLSPQQSGTNVTADYYKFSAKGTSYAKGHVVVTQPGRRLLADRAVLRRDPVTHKINVIDLYDHVRIYESGKLVVANHIRLHIKEKSGQLDQVYYRWRLNDDAAALFSIPSNAEPLTAWGQASQAQQLHQGLYIFHDVTYSTCTPVNEVWNLTAQKIKLDQAKGRGTAENILLKVRNIPVFYFPYLNFPINHERKTGFLFPLVGSSSSSGLEFGLPFYWNIAPNYDATITPYIYSQRGVLTDTHFRYLTQNSHGMVTFAGILNDREFVKFRDSAAANYPNQFGLPSLLNASKNRYFTSFKDDTEINQHVHAHLDVAKVSDDYYFQDFNATPELTTLNQLQREGDIYFDFDHWHGQLTAQDYQTLHAVNRPEVENLYRKLPQLNLTGDYPNIDGNLDFQMLTSVTNFDKEFGPGDLTEPVDGMRLYLTPSISYPMRTLWGYIRPSVQIWLRDYQLRNTVPQQKSTITEAIPVYTVDSGLYFDRDFHALQQNYLQTLEPRLYFAYIPFHNQNMLPNFDSGYIPFTYSQVFQPERFSGYDRIGDTLQLGYGAQSRILSAANGDEKFALGAGQIYFFKRRDVNVCNTLGCSDSVTQAGAISNTASFSPLALFSRYDVNRNLSINDDLAWQFSNQQAITADAYLHWQDPSGHIFNAGYGFLRNGNLNSNTNILPISNLNKNLHLVNINGVTPVTQNWDILGLLSYDIAAKHAQSYLGGIEYNACCWRFRLVGGRVFTAIDQNGQAIFHNAVYVQWQLKGLASIGTSSMSEWLTGQITGYQDPFMQNVLR